ncbi:MAG: hydroxyethylthiazole kinase [Hyphomicrobiales bacterium]|nr:hydroxyethylthiazole kinase [Hyphomicrobiales bacterium]
MGMQEIASETARLLARMRAARPLVQNITNFVSMDIAANVLLAAGAAPAMVHAPEESPEFVRRAAALVINTGTLSQPWADSMEVATTAARVHGTPWVLDPVGAGGTQFRDHVIQKLLRHRPAIIRGNASEIMAVANACGLSKTDEPKARPRGVDSAHATSEAELPARRLARHSFCVVAATGAIDLVTDGERLVRLANGSPLMERVTALGCGLTSLIGAFAGLGEDPFIATVAAIGVYGVAGDMAAETASGPGSFRTAFIDALDRIDEGEILARLKTV